MNGLDKIIAQILDDAKQESLAIREKQPVKRRRLLRQPVKR